MSSTVACPRCKTKQPRRETASQYKCPKCNGLFDDDPDEGGSFFDDPTKRVEHEERRRQRNRRD